MDWGLERAGFGLTTVDYGGLGTRESRFWTDYSGLERPKIAFQMTSNMEPDIILCLETYQTNVSVAILYAFVIPNFHLAVMSCLIQGK